MPGQAIGAAPSTSTFHLPNTSFSQPWRQTCLAEHRQRCWQLHSSPLSSSISTPWQSPAAAEDEEVDQREDQDSRREGDGFYECTVAAAAIIGQEDGGDESGGL